MKLIDFETWLKRNHMYVVENLTGKKITQDKYQITFPDARNKKEMVTAEVTKDLWDELTKLGMNLWHLYTSKDQNNFILEYDEGMVIVMSHYSNGDLESVNEYKFSFEEKGEYIHWRFNPMNIKEEFPVNYREVESHVKYLKYKEIDKAKNRLNFITGVIQ
jgi:hypothetical protein